MLRFLRNIRIQALKSSSIRRYVLYAIGEDLLVMIGILLALQVNNWNEARQKSEYEYKLLKELHSNLIYDIDYNQFKIDHNQSSLRSCQVILDCLQNQREFNRIMQNFPT